MNMLKKSMMTMVLGLSIASIATPAFASEYKVQANETFWTIAQKKNIPLKSILAANPHVDAMNLQIGQVIQLNEADLFITAGNETFWTISQKLHIPMHNLLDANPEIDPLNLYPGVKLQLPTFSTKSTVSGLPSPLSMEISAVATAYSPAPGENGGWGGLDYFGNALKVGTIAVDPAVIPLGSKVYISGYSFPGLPENGMIAYAMDIGSAIKGNRVDIFVPGSPESVSNFGFQNVKISVLK